MRNTMFVRLMSSMVIVALLNLGFVQSAIAAGIDTATVARLEDRTEALARIDAQLSRADVRDALIGLGVDPAQAKFRVGALTEPAAGSLRAPLQGRSAFPGQAAAQRRARRVVHVPVASRVPARIRSS